jgi:hypothetical protein
MQETLKDLEIDKQQMEKEKRSIEEMIRELEKLELN